MCPRQKFSTSQMRTFADNKLNTARILELSLEKRKIVEQNKGTGYFVHHFSFDSLTLHYTMMTFNDLENKASCKHCRKISIHHGKISYISYLSKSISISAFVICKCFEFVPVQKIIVW